jgi:hypothetical protein
LCFLAPGAEQRRFPRRFVLGHAAYTIIGYRTLQQKSLTRASLACARVAVWGDQPLGRKTNQQTDAAGGEKYNKPAFSAV